MQWQPHEHENLLPVNWVVLSEESVHEAIYVSRRCVPLLLLWSCSVTRIRSFAVANTQEPHQYGVGTNRTPPQIWSCHSMQNVSENVIKNYRGMRLVIASSAVVPILRCANMQSTPAIRFYSQ